MSKNIHAVELGRLGGRKRAKVLTAAQRSAIARKASLSRGGGKINRLSGKIVLDKPEEEALS